VKLLLPEVEVTNSLSSNMIKAYTIAYDKQKVKVLDTEEREKALEDKLQELLPFRPFLTAETQEKEGDEEFVPGIFAEDIGELILDEPTQPPVQEVDLEAIKASLREEVSAEIALEYQKQAGEILANAQAQAEELLATAKRDAETAKESILKLASAQGYEEGLKRAKAEEERMRLELETEKARIQQEYERQVSELEPAFVKILKELVKKVSGVAYEYHDEVLTYLIACGAGFASKDTEFTVWLSEPDYERFADKFTEIKEKFSETLVLEFKPSEELSVGCVKLENENRVIDCGLGTELEGLLEELSLLG